jgi:Uma2 family endonuclease
MATSAPAFVSLEEYLRTTYRPDRDWIDGEARERNAGEQSHARIQAYLSYLFRLRASQWRMRGLPEQRVQVLPNRFRIPDLCAIPAGDPLAEILRTPPILCVEILSREDRMSDIQERVEDYLAMGVQAVWVIDPGRRRAYEALRNGALQPVVAELTVAGTDVRIPISDNRRARRDRAAGLNHLRVHSSRPGRVISSRMASFGLLAWWRISSICWVMGISTL